MNTSWKAVFVSSILALAASVAMNGWSGDSQPNRVPTVRIRLFNYAGLPARLVSEAKKNFDKVFRNAGIEASWHECDVDAAWRAADPACTVALDGDEFGVRIMARFEAPKDQFQLGQAHGRFIDLYWNNIENIAATASADRQIVLACVLAHELGHLLLGTTGHSAQGVMSTAWDRETLRRAARGNLVFTTDEAQKARSSLAERMAMISGVERKPPDPALAANLTPR